MQRCIMVRSSVWSMRLACAPWIATPAGALAATICLVAICKPALPLLRGFCKSWKKRRALFLRLGGEEQRIALALAELGCFLRLGVGDVLGEHRDHAGAALVRRHHHVVGLV